MKTALLRKIAGSTGPEIRALTLSGNEITDATRRTATAGDGLLNDSSFGIWPAATNMITAPAALGGAPWTTDNSGAVTVTSATEADPGGGITGALYTFTGASHAVRQLKTVLASTTYTWSFWVKRGTATELKYSIYDQSNLANIVAATSYYASTSAIYSRFSVTFTTPVGCTAVYVYFDRDSAATGTFYAAWPQLETGSVATPYTPTSRSAGRVQAPASLLDETQGWVAMRVRVGFADSTALTSTAEYPIAFCWGNALVQERVVMYWEQYANVWTVSRSNGAGAAVTSAADTFAVGDYRTLIAAWTATEVKVSVDGSALTSAANAIIPTVSSAPRIGTDQDDAYFWSGDFLWFACGTGTLSDGDAANIHSFGNSDRGLYAYPGHPTGFWSAANGFMEVRP